MSSEYIGGQHMKKWLIVLLSLFAFSAGAQAQSFGVKFIGVQYNTFNPGQGTGLQFTLGTLIGSTDLEVNLLLGRIALTTDKKFTFYYGAGAHVGAFGLFRFADFGVGAHGVLGVDYLLQPGLALGVGFHPGITYYFSSIGFWFYYGGGLYLQFKI
jgi:hypothetical protein